MFEFIEVLRAIATILIANSHFKGVYPTDIISFGGGLGLALFYMLSGFLLSGINTNTSFGKWYFRKVARLYIPLWIFRVFEIGTGFLVLASPKEVFHYCVFPASWFVASMVVLYPIYFGYVKYLCKKNTKIIDRTIAILFIAYSVIFVLKPDIATFSFQELTVQKPFAIETPYLISLLIWMTAMLIGLRIKVSHKRIPHIRVTNLILSGICVLLFLVIRLLTRNGHFANAEYLLYVVYLGFALFLFRFFEGMESELKRISKTKMMNLLKNISKCSLEIYYVQFIWIAAFKEMAFPLNFGLIISVVFLSGSLLHYASNKVTRIVTN